jgi:signal transduction histidine kinase
LVRLGEAVEAAIYYVVAESLTNAAKHANASEASVVISTTSETVVVEIRDNGRGGANLTQGSGLQGLADRIEALGGQLQVQSHAAGGTVIKAELPVH